MCFMKIYNVEHVENPDAGTTFSVFDAVDVDTARHHIQIAADIFVNNQIVTRALELAANSGVEKQLGVDETIPRVGDRTVVLCSVNHSHRLYPNIAHPEIVYASHDIRLQDKTITLQLKDFSFLAMRSLTFNTPRNAELRVTFGLESDNITVYNHI